MKKFFKPIAVLFSAALTLTSCVDNTVSDLVNQIRTNQNALLAARVRLAEAQADEQEINNAYQEAINAINIESAESNLEVQIAQNAYALVYAEEELEQAELALQQAIDALNDYLEQNGLNEAATYLSNYQTAMTNVFNTTGLIYAKEEAIATLELFLTPLVGPPANAETFALWQELLERDLAEAEADLAAKEAALVVLEGVAADPSTAQAALADVNGDLLELSNEKLGLDVEVAELTNAKEVANDAVTTLTGGTLLSPNPDGTVTVANSVIGRYEAAEADVETYTEALAAAELTVTNLNVTLANANTNLNNAQQLLDNYTNELVAKFGTYNTRLNSAKALGQTLKDKITELDILEAQGVTGTPLTTAQTAVTNAITPFVAVVGDQVGAGRWTDFSDILISDVDDAIADPKDTNPTSTTDLESAAVAYNGAKVFFGGGQPANTLITNIGKWTAATFIANFELNGTLAGVPVLDPAPNGSLLDAVSDIEVSIDENTNGKDNNADGDVIDALDLKGIAGNTELKEAAEAKVAEYEASYDEAVADLPGLKDALTAANDALTAKNAEVAAVNAMIHQLGLVKAKLVLEVAPAGLNAEIATRKNEIEAAKDLVAATEAQLAKVGFDIDEVNAKIAQEEADLAKLVEIRAAHQAQADGWKALLDAALD